MSAGDLCHSKGASGDLCFKTGDGRLCYKKAATGWTTISFAWRADSTDLDICAYFTGAPGTKMGYGHNTSEDEQTNGSYHIRYSGDIKGSGGSEWLRVKIDPPAAAEFKVHLNFYGEADTPICDVVASQAGGQTLFLTGVSCGSREGEAASTGDPAVVVTFDAQGRLTGLSAG